MHGAIVRSPMVAVAAVTFSLALGGAPGPASAAPDCAPVPGERIDTVPYAQQRFAPGRLATLATGRGVTVAVVDSGVDAGHRQLAGRVQPGRDYLRGAPDARRDCNGHGTGVAGVIVAGPPKDGPRAAVDLQGLAPDARILPVRVSERADTAERGGEDPVDAATFARSIRWAAQRATVVNLSLALYEDDPAVAAAVRYARDRDVVVVAAAGNRGRADAGNPTPYPAGYPGVLGVGAVDDKGRHADFSQRGGYVDVVAPGTGVTVAATDGGYRRADGTSFATPFVAATAALLRERFPTMTAEQVVRRIIATADPAPGGRDDAYGAGVVNPYRALTESLAAPPADRPAVVSPRGADPALMAARQRRDEARTRALTVAGAGAAAVAVAALAALVLPRGARRRWRPAAAAR